MSFNTLPDELKILIIEQTLPEGFESLAVTCKRVSELCKPFIAGHNALRSRYRSFAYRLDDPAFEYSMILTAFHLIARIASEPIVARYIQHADLKWDSRPSLNLDRKYSGDFTNAEEQHLDAVAELVQSSAAVRQAGLDPEQYYAILEEEVYSRRYSQYAAAFLLTLLPNIITLKLPQHWKPNEASNRLLSCIGDESSLSKIVFLGNSTSSVVQDTFGLGWVQQLLALPTVESFKGYSIIGSPEMSTGRSLRSIRLFCSCLHARDIDNLLSGTSSLRILYYSHSIKTKDADWDICAFIEAIARQVGSHLEELSVSTIDTEPDLHLQPGRASLKRLQRLRVLEIPIELAECNINAAASHRGDDSGLFEELVPSSVSTLSIISQGSLLHRDAIAKLFSKFPQSGQEPISSLADLYLNLNLTFPKRAEESFQHHCLELQSRFLKSGVRVHLPTDARRMIMERDF